jgi:hypothetical protein
MKRPSPGRAHRLASFAVFALLSLCLPGVAPAQWATNGDNINNTNTGNVGVGTAAPTSKLDVTFDGAVERGVRIFDTRPAGAEFGGHLLFYGHSNGTTTAARFGQIGGLKENATGGSMHGFLGFYTNNGAATYSVVERMRISSAGNVGVGTANPAYPLDVNGITNSRVALFLRSDRTDQAGRRNWGITTEGWTVGDFVIMESTANNTAPSVPRLAILSGGNVGIGTTTPDFVGWGSSRRVLTIRGAGERGVLELASPSTGASGVASSIVGMNGAARLAQIDISADGAPNSGGMEFYTWNAGAYGQRMRIDRLGNVGVGTSAPASKLHVAGDITVDGNINAKYQDVAEWVPSKQKLAAGTVVVLDAGRTNHVLASTKAYDTAVAGVISDSPGVILGEGGEGKLKVATTGRAKVKVDATRVAIKVGDLLVTSAVEGVAMKSVPVDLGGVAIHRPGTIIGKALEPLEKGTGEILVLLSLQ